MLRKWKKIPHTKTTFRREQSPVVPRMESITVSEAEANFVNLFKIIGEGCSAVHELPDLSKGVISSRAGKESRSSLNFTSKSNISSPVTIKHNLVLEFPQEYEPFSFSYRYRLLDISSLKLIIMGSINQSSDDKNFKNLKNNVCGCRHVV